jgi:hypothetical protein
MCDGSSGDTCNKLGRDDQKGSEGLDSSNEEETERDLISGISNNARNM